MSEGIKSLATTAGYFAPGAGVLDALGMYPDENSQSMLANLKAGEFGRAGMQGLGALGDALLLTGVGAPLGLGLKTVSKAGQLSRAGKGMVFRGRKHRDNITNNPIFESDELVKVMGKELPFNSRLMNLLTPKKAGDKQNIEATSDVLTQMFKKDKSIAGAPSASGSGSKYFTLQKDVGLGMDNPARVTVRVSDHPPRLKGLGKERSGGRGDKRFREADVRINISPDTPSSMSVEEAMGAIKNMYIKPGKIEEIVRSGRKVTGDDLLVATIKDGKVVSKKAPYQYREGGMTPFGMDVSQL
jgi:hypothetical protein